jgi:hypothetical protein
MSDWKLHIPTDSNIFYEYKCGLVAGQRVALRKDLEVKNLHGNPTGEVHSQGERWIVLPGILSDPVVWLRQADGQRCTWDDDPTSIAEWFEVLNPSDGSSGSTAV